MKSRLNCLLLTDKWSDEGPSSESKAKEIIENEADEGLGDEDLDSSENETGQDEEQMWAGMEVVGGKKRQHSDCVRDSDTDSDEDSSVNTKSKVKHTGAKNNGQSSRRLRSRKSKGGAAAKGSQKFTEKVKSPSGKTKSE